MIATLSDSSWPVPKTANVNNVLKLLAICKEARDKKLKYAAALRQKMSKEKR